jgi:hypothetical protein
VRCLDGYALQAIGRDGVDLVSLTGSHRLHEASDLVVLITGYEPVAGLADELGAAGVPVTVAGDAARPGRLRDATRSGMRAVLEFNP